MKPTIFKKNLDFNFDLAKNRRQIYNAPPAETSAWRDSESKKLLDAKAPEATAKPEDKIKPLESKLSPAELKAAQDQKLGGTIDALKNTRSGLAEMKAALTNPAKNPTPNNPPDIGTKSPEKPSEGEDPKIPERPKDALTGTKFGEKLKAMEEDFKAKAFAEKIKGKSTTEVMAAMEVRRAQMIMDEVRSGNIPPKMRKLKDVAVEVADPQHPGQKIRGVMKVMPDYIAIGDDKDHLRVPMTPAVAQAIANEWGMTLPTPKMVDAIAKAADVKLKPSPKPAGREMTSTDYFIEHNQTINTQIQEAEAKGEFKMANPLIADHKKDLVLTYDKDGESYIKIYGWHFPDGSKIQGYSGKKHEQTYADYSHGVRLISKKIYIEGVGNRDISEVLRHENLHHLLTAQKIDDAYHQFPATSGWLSKLNFNNPVISTPSKVAIAALPTAPIPEVPKPQIVEAIPPPPLAPKIEKPVPDILDIANLKPPMLEPKAPAATIVEKPMEDAAAKKAKEIPQKDLQETPLAPKLDSRTPPPVGYGSNLPPEPRPAVQAAPTIAPPSVYDAAPSPKPFFPPTPPAAPFAPLEVAPTAAPRQKQTVEVATGDTYTVAGDSYTVGYRPYLDSNHIPMAYESEKDSNGNPVMIGKSTKDILDQVTKIIDHTPKPEETLVLAGINDLFNANPKNPDSVEKVYSNLTNNLNEMSEKLTTAKIKPVFATLPNLNNYITKTRYPNDPKSQKVMVNLLSRVNDFILHQITPKPHQVVDLYKNNALTNAIGAKLHPGSDGYKLIAADFKSALEPAAAADNLLDQELDADDDHDHDHDSEPQNPAPAEQGENLPKTPLFSFKYGLANQAATEQAEVFQTPTGREIHFEIKHQPYILKIQPDQTPADLQTINADYRNATVADFPQNGHVAYLLLHYNRHEGRKYQDGKESTIDFELFTQDQSGAEKSIQKGLSRYETHQDKPWEAHPNPHPGIAMKIKKI